MRLIDAEKYREEWLKFRTFEPMLLLDQQPTVEAISKDQYEARLKADMVAMLTEIQFEIEELQGKYSPYYDEASQHTSELIQQKINKLKGEEDGNDD